MKISLCTLGKEHEHYISEGVLQFTKRISNYYPVTWTILPPPKNAGLLSQKEVKQKEAELVSSWLKGDDYLITLDERGQEISSEGVANLIQARANESSRNLVFLIGGAFGLDDALLQKAGFKWSLSRLTFPHQLVRLILAEQIYRACTILRNEKYHHR